MIPKLLLALSIVAVGCNQVNRYDDHRLASPAESAGIRNEEQITQLIDRGWHYFDRGSYADAGKYADSIIAYSDYMDYPIGRAEGFLLSGRISFMSGNHDRALDLENKALRIFQSTGNQEKVIKAYMAIGNSNERLGKYTEAVSVYQRIFQILGNLDNSPAHAEAYNDLGVVFFRMGHYAEALKHYLSSLRMYKALGNQAGVASVKNNIGLIYVRDGNAGKAIDYFQQAVAGGNDLEGGTTAAKAHSNLGTLYAHQGNYDLAIQHQNAALDIFERANNRSGMAEAYSSLGITHFGLQQYPEALSYFQTSAHLARETGNLIFLASALTNSGNVYSSLGDLATGKEAVHLYQKALNDQLQSIAIADSIRARETLANAYDGITFTYRGLNNVETALEYTELLLILKDSLRNSETDRQLEELRTQYEVERVMVRERDKQKQRNEWTLLIAGSIVLIAMLVYLLHRQRLLRRREKERADNLHQMAALELQGLRAQLNPHFMFNALNAIQELILRKENEKSHIYLSQFSQLLRMLLENADAPLIPLAKELNFLHNYLDLEKLRLPDLEYILIIDPEIRQHEIMIPNMILQPYVENAIWHGLSYRPPGDRRITIRIYQKGERIHYEIEDNGIGRARADEIKNTLRRAHRSKGMELLRKRFVLVKAQFNMEIETRIEDLCTADIVTGTRVTIVVPISLKQATTLIYA